MSKIKAVGCCFVSEIVSYRYPLTLTVELNIRMLKWFFLSINRPQNQNAPFFVEKISKHIEKLGRYENVLIFGDFNMKPGEKTCLDYWKSATFATKSKALHVLSLGRDDALTNC